MLANLLGRQTTPEDALKGAQLLAGRTKAKVDTLRGDLDAARRALAGLIAEESVAIMDSDVMPMAPNKALLGAQNRVRQLEGALALAEERDAAAQLELRRSVQYVEASKEEAAVAHLKFKVGPRADALFVQIEEFVENELIPAINEARITGGIGIHQSFLTDITTGFEMHFLRSARSLVPKGRAHIVLLRDRKFSDLIPDPSVVAQRRGIRK